MAHGKLTAFQRDEYNSMSEVWFNYRFYGKKHALKMSWYYLMCATMTDLWS